MLCNFHAQMRPVLVMRANVLDLVARFSYFKMTVLDVLVWLGGVQERDNYSAIIQTIILCDSLRRRPRDVRWCAKWFIAAREIAINTFTELVTPAALASATTEPKRAELMKRVFDEANKRIKKAGGELKNYDAVSPSTFAQMLWGHKQLYQFKELNNGA